MKLRNITIILSLVIFSFSGIAQSHIYYNNLENVNTNGNWLGLSTIDTIQAHSGMYSSSTDSLKPYGLGIEQGFEDDLHYKNTMVYVSGYVNSSIKNNNALFVITLINNNGTVVWKGIPLSHIFTDTNTWYHFSDSILIPAKFTSNSKIKAYLWNQNKKAITGIDDLKFEFKAINNPSFVPNIISKEDIKTAGNLTKQLFSNNFYSINYSPKQKSISISSNNNQHIISNIFYVTEYNLNDNNSFSLQREPVYQKSKNTPEGRILYFIADDNNSKAIISIVCNDNSHTIKFLIKKRFKKNQTLSRESLVFEYSQPLSKVYRNNRFVDAANFQKEYWLDRQGVKIGDEISSMYIYHTPDISSLQLDVKNHFLIANLDFEKDHPFFRFPLNADSSNWKKEESKSIYKRGDERSYSFEIVVGNRVPNIPRFMKNPLGYEATYIWTEHADFTDIKTNRATYFGSEKITSADSAIGGFIKYNIPVTKSVFYDNPDSITNFTASSGNFPSLESTILTDSLFSDFLFQISDKGNEICLHTPEQFTTTPQRLEEALLFMQTNFGSPSWIDHGNNNGPLSNREDLICDGTLEDSPYYAIDLWNKYGVKYLHNAYYEELNTYKGWQFESSIEKPFSGYGDFFPKPDYYKHPTRSKNIYHWTTTSALFISEPYLWDYLFKISKLQSLINNRAVEINHVYPPWVNPKKGMWTYDSDSTIIAQPGFNRVLKNMAKLRDAGKLNVCTVADFLNYRIALDSVSYQILSDGRIRLSNNSSNKIVGLSMVAKASAVSVNGIIPNKKIVGDEIIFWFNINAGEIKVIRIIE